MLAEVYLLLTIFIITLVFYGVNKRPPNYAPVLKLSFPILGHFPYFGKYERIGLHKMFVKWGKDSNSPLIGVDFGTYRAVVINDFKLIKEAWNRPELSGRVKAQPFAVLGGGTIRGLICSDGPSWNEQKRFTLRHLREFGFGKQSTENIISVEAEELVNNLLNQNGKPLSTLALFNHAVLNCSWKIISNERFPHDDPKLTEMLHAVTSNVQTAKAMGAIIFMPWICKLVPKLSGWTSMVETFTVMRVFMTQFVESRLQNHVNGSNEDFTGAYIDEILKTKDLGSSFYGEEGKQQLVTVLVDLFMAGAESTATTISWLSIYMALHTTVQELVHHEIDAVVGKSRLPTLEDRALMPYTQACILETLRVSSIVPIGLFHRALQDVTLNGTFIPRETIVIGNLYAVNHDPDIWGQNVEEFDPRRFLSPNMSELIPREELLAFSSGKRQCPGESLARNELFLFTTSILQKLEIRQDLASSGLSMDQNVGGFVCAPLPHKLIFSRRD